MKKFGPDNLDVLQNIEFSIIEVYRSDIPLSALVECLREIQKSIPRWSRQGGRKGYFDFVSQYLP